MTVKARLRRELARVPGALAVARLTVETIRVCLRYRVTGLASEAGFFMLLSLPPLLLGLFGGVGYLGQWLGQATVNRILDGVQSWAEAFLTADLIADTLLPTVQDVLETGRFDLISVGFVLSVWSGSRALNVFVDTISIMYGQSGVRGIVRTRALSLTLYFLSLLVGVVVIPLVVIGPTWVRDLLPEELELLAWLYWPTVTILAVASIATLFHISTPRRTPWWRDVPGAALTLGLWSLASFVLRGTIEASLDGTSIYGPLSAPIVLLIWLYFLAIAILIGAALNAAVRILWPVEERPSARAKAVSWIKDQVEARRGETVAGDEGLFDATVAGGAVAGGAVAGGAVAGGAVPGRPAARGAGFAASGAPRVGASSGTHASRSSPVPLTPTREKPTRPRRTSRSDGGGATAQSGGKAPGQAGGNAPAQPGRKARDADAATEADGDAGAAGDLTGSSSGDGSVATGPATESGGTESERAKSEAAASGDGEKVGERGSSEVSPGPESGPAKETRRGLRRRRRAQFVDGDEDRLMSVRTHSAE